MPKPEQPLDSKYLAELVNRFLRWPLPASVCSDPCATQQGYPNRVGTNLLTADEAKLMLQYVLDDARDFGESGALPSIPAAPEQPAPEAAPTIDTPITEAFALEIDDVHASEALEEWAEHARRLERTANLMREALLQPQDVVRRNAAIAAFDALKEGK